MSLKPDAIFILSARDGLLSSDNVVGTMKISDIPNGQDDGMIPRISREAALKRCGLSNAPKERNPQKTNAVF